MFLNGFSIDCATEVFEKLANLAFGRKKFLNIPLPTIVELLISFFADGLYKSENLEAALKQVFGTERSILDYSYATSRGTRVGLPVATVHGKPSCRIFTNYNGVGDRTGNRGNCEAIPFKYSADVSSLCYQAKGRRWKSFFMGNVS
jgi:hypothetical protein